MRTKTGGEQSRLGSDNTAIELGRNGSQRSSSEEWSYGWNYFVDWEKWIAEIQVLPDKPREASITQRHIRT